MQGLPGNVTEGPTSTARSSCAPCRSSGSAERRTLTQLLEARCSLRPSLMCSYRRFPRRRRTRGVVPTLFATRRGRQVVRDRRSRPFRRALPLLHKPPLAAGSTRAAASRRATPLQTGPDGWNGDHGWTALGHDRSTDQPRNGIHRRRTGSPRTRRTIAGRGAHTGSAGTAGLRADAPPAHPPAPDPAQSIRTEVTA